MWISCLGTAPVDDAGQLAVRNKDVFDGKVGVHDSLSLRCDEVIIDLFGEMAGEGLPGPMPLCRSGSVVTQEVAGESARVWQGLLV